MKGMLIFILLLAMAGSAWATDQPPGQPASQPSAQAKQSEPEINQKVVCQTYYHLRNPVCTPGQKIVFMLANPGDMAQNIFVSQNCDLRYSVVVTNYGATCIFAPYEQYIVDKESHY